ncbi:MAG: zinc ribbon domain-containing protein [Kiritimatiellae bacterium]|nr:zinc ribbon domain-containing protein [Kiritimatiellia bacterium]MDW8458414.1 zinc ribbon domain-containing protein [Verrucomicrobiota bacterium]
MPLYEFHCNECGQEIELLVRSADWRGTACPLCGSSRLVKKLSVFAAGSSSSKSMGDLATDSPCCGASGADGACCGGSCSWN